MERPPITPEPAKVHRFSPSRGLRVLIDHANPRDPYELSEEVKYRNGPFEYTMPAGFKCDASSTPFFVWLIPGTLEVLLAVSWWFGAPTVLIAVLFCLSVVLSFGMPYLMPAVGQLGLHARAVFLHDAIYRRQDTTRLMADAVCAEVMEYDGVHWGPRWVIYLLLRFFGWRAWRKNTAILAGAIEPTNPGPEPKSVIVPTTAPASPAVEKAISRVL